MGPEIYKVELIGSGSLSVMAKPVAGEWIEEEFRGIANHGIDCIVSLLEDFEAHEVGLERECELAKESGMTYVSYPIPDRGLPSSVSKFSAFTKQLYQQAAGGSNIVVHCRAGIGRTGLIAAGILLHCAFEPIEAFSHVSAARGVAVPDTPEQIKWLTENYEHIIDT